MDEFISEPITVESKELTTAPKTFVWRGVRHEVAEVIKMWQDWHTPPGAKHAQRWMHRRHRNCFVVRTTGGDASIDGFAGPVDVEVERGRVHLAPRAALAAEVKASATHGEVRLEKRARDHSL